MTLIRCENGHFYDADRFPACPFCQSVRSAEPAPSPAVPQRFREMGELSTLASGSVGRVYKLTVQTHYALKQIDCGDDMVRFKNALYERDILQRLSDCEGVVKLVDSEITTAGGEYAVSLLLEYHTPLKTWIRENRPDLAAQFRLMEQLCDILIRCRNRGVLHLDLRPDNVFVGRDGKVRLGDFSCSLLISDLSRNHITRGTSVYIAPEVYGQGLCSEQSEIFSLGVMLDQLLNGTGDEARIIRYMSPGKELLDSLLSKALAREPALRFRSFEQLQEAIRQLREVCGASHAYAQPESTPDRQPCAASREPEYLPSFDADDFAATTALTDTLYSGPEFSMVPPAPQAPARGSFCSVCGSAVQSGSLFCNNCGRRVGAAPAPWGNAMPSAPAQPAPPVSPGAMPTPMPVPMPAPVMSAAPSMSAPPAPAPQADIRKAQFSAVVPKTFLRGEYTMVEIVMYEEKFRHVVDELIAQAEGPVSETKSGVMKVAEESRVRITLTSPDVQIDDDTDEQVWFGDYLNFTFAVELPEDYKKKQILFTASVYINDVIATRLKFVAKVRSFLEQKVTITREDVLSAFVSYASQDRARVATIIQGMRKARPEMDIFFDVDSLRSGEDWELALRREIERRDILYLCWSQNARASQWVDTEWRLALAQKGVECIEPIAIDPPDICPPPAELMKKHFNDKLLYYINAPRL